MLLTIFVKINGNCEIRSVECAVVPEEMLALQTQLSASGFELADSSEYVAQMINASHAVVPPGVSSTPLPEVPASGEVPTPTPTT